MDDAPPKARTDGAATAVCPDPDQSPVALAPAPLPPRAVIFDWDNTLIDSWPCIHLAINQTLSAMGHSPWTMADTRARVGLSMREAFPALFGDRWPEARDIFFAAFEAMHLEMLTEAPGARRLLETLSRRGLPLVVVSNKTGDFLRREAEVLGWTGWFQALVGAQDAPRDKPAADPVHMALSTTGVDAGPEVWFVGDALVDMHCAHATGCWPVLVRPEPPGPGEFDASPPARYCPDCTAVLRLITAALDGAPDGGSRVTGAPRA